MDSSSRTGLVTSLFFGVLAVALVKDTVGALGLGVWLIAALAAVPWQAKTSDFNPKWHLGVAALFAALLLWRDSPQLRWANVIAVTCLVGLAALKMSLRRAEARDYVRGFAFAWILPLYSAPLLKTVRVPPATARADHLKGLWRGFALATPALVVFGMLFASADAAFAASIESIMTIDEDAISQTAQVVLWVLVAAGFVAGLLSSLSRPAPAQAARTVPALGTIELTVFLGSLIALFGAFVAMQFQHLFGGAGRVREVAGLTYAEYARSGFFELVAVAALVTWLFVGLEARVGVDSRRTFRVLGGMLIVLTLPIVASGLMRMSFYVESYGLTVLRLYTSALMVWMGVTLLWMTGTLLRGHRARFAFGSFAAALCGIVALNVANPDALIARYNLGQPKTDLAYLQSLSLDAVPAVLSAAPGSPSVTREELDRYVAAKRERLAQSDWRDWSGGMRLASVALAD